MKKLFTFLLCFGFAASLFAKPVSLQTAKQVAGYFYTTQAVQGAQYKQNADMVLAYTSQSKSHSSTALTTPVNYFYVFNAGNKNGFVIVAADDNVKPILGYSNEGEIVENKVPENVAKWLEGYKAQIQYVIENNIDGAESVKAEWDNYLNERTLAKKETNAVSPLVKTKWDQSPYYNALCPFDNTHSERTVTGCVATAMAQVMKYWSYPENGTGFHSYNHNTYGTLSSNFGTTTYEWAKMPNSVTSSNNAVATLMSHCGVSVDMNYGVASTGGSGAYVIKDASPVTNCAEYALVNYFGYSNKMQGVQRTNYTDSQWEKLLKTELDASRPIIYAGFGSGGGHCFVCDGYDDNGYFHFNWGWSGYYDGYFVSDALNPGGVGTGGGTGGFNSGQQAIIGIQPPSGGGGTTNADLQLYDEVTISSSSAYYGQGFSVHTDILNNSTSDFSGEYCAALFDNTGTFVDFIETKTNITLPAGYHYTSGITFQSQGMLSALPGNYSISIFYKPTGGNWILLEGGSYYNSVALSVINPNDIELYSSMVVTPGASSLVQNGSASVKVDFANYGSAAYLGTLDVSLYNLDGSFAASIESKTNVSICTQCHFTNGLTFSTNNLQVEPGTYLLAVLHKPEGGDWQIAGSTYYTNPIKVIVKSPAITPDNFEDNNSVTKAYMVNPTYSNNSASFKSTGSNIHVGSDYDYYKINLPAGYDYSINARVHDAESSTNGNTYSEDVLFSYSKDGSTWSDAYDATMPNKLNIKGGGTVYFMVSPYFQGETGTYLLDVNISRTKLATGLEEETTNIDLSVSPNPAKTYLQLNIGENIKEVRSVKIVDIAGREVMQVNQPQITDKYTTLPVDKLLSGAYFVVVETDKGIWKNKFIKVQ